MNADNSINLIDFFSKVLSFYKIYVPIIATAIVLGYVLTDKSPEYKTTVILTDIYGVMNTKGIENSDIFREEKIKFKKRPRRILEVTYISKDKSVKNYIESLLSKYESSYSAYEVQRTKLVSDYSEKNNTDTFRFRSIDEYRTYIFWKEYDNQALFDYKWLPVKTVNSPVLANVINPV